MDGSGTSRTSLLARWRARDERAFFVATWQASPGGAAAWWALLVLRALLPAAVSIAVGVVVGAVAREGDLVGPLVAFGVVFVLLQVVLPLHQAVSANLGSRMSGWLNDRLVRACTAPPGIGHLERPDLVGDLTVARDFDLGVTGPPLSIGIDFVAGGLADLLGGILAAAVLFGFSWWAPPVLIVAWGATHWLLRESAIWFSRQTDEVRLLQRHTEYAYRLAVDAPAAKEVRLFGLAPWVLARFAGSSRRLQDLRWRETRLRERSVLRCVAVVLIGNGLVAWRLAADVTGGHLDLAHTVTFAQAMFAASAIAFGGLNWALEGAAAPVGAVARLEAAMAGAGALAPPGGAARPATGRAEPADPPTIRFRDVRFAYPAAADDEATVLDGLDLEIPAGTSLAIVGRNGAGKTTLAKLLCRLYDPTSGAIEVDGVDLRDLDVDAWRSRLTAVFQDFVHYDWPLRDNVAPRGAPDEVVTAALEGAGATGLASLDAPMSRAYAGGVDLSGGQWQRVALARALAAVAGGARLVLLDEPTAMLDVRGEAEIFERVLAATRSCTTILVSHRFSTVRQADRICVVEHGRVVELGTHDELMALGGRYHTMYTLQASRFAEGSPELDDEGQEVNVEHL